MYTQIWGKKSGFLTFRLSTMNTDDCDGHLALMWPRKFPWGTQRYVRRQQALTASDFWVKRLLGPFPWNPFFFFVWAEETGVPKCPAHLPSWPWEAQILFTKLSLKIKPLYSTNLGSCYCPYLIFPLKNPTCFVTDSELRAEKKRWRVQIHACHLTIKTHRTCPFYSQ